MFSINYSYLDVVYLTLIYNGKLQMRTQFIAQQICLSVKLFTRNGKLSIVNPVYPQM